MDRNPAVVTMAEYAVYQPGMAALTVRTNPRSFTQLNQYAGAGFSFAGLDVVGLAVVVAAILIVAHLARKR